jgi:hypothetical protein
MDYPFISCSIICIDNYSYYLCCSFIPRYLYNEFHPDEYKFKQLYDDFSDTLNCRCSRISIPYNLFTDSQATFHEVCASQFITQEWIDMIYGASVSFISSVDIRTTLSAFWQLYGFQYIYSKAAYFT